LKARLRELSPEHPKRTSKFCETQIVTILREADAGTAVAELLRTHAFGRATCYLWKQKYGRAGVPELPRLKALKQENLGGHLKSGN
jgi:putative transposase